MINLKQKLTQLKEDLKDKDILNKYLFENAILIAGLYFFIYEPASKKLKNSRKRSSSLYRKNKELKRKIYSFSRKKQNC